MTDESIYELKLAALLHDIGKIGVPEAILRKPARLDDWEKKIMDEHVTRGYEALVKIPRLKRVSELVLRHHEWWDGRGYPGRLAGEEIPLEARIIAVVDAYDAMTSDRPYRAGMSPDLAIKRLREAAGTQFDPRIVDCFAACLTDGLLGDRNVTVSAL
jgi:HD-GYP domain-containing protein (c-di-GMP phosphodiesterase class II)